MGKALEQAKRDSDLLPLPIAPKGEVALRARNRWKVIPAVAVALAALAVSSWWVSSRKPNALTSKDTIVIADFSNSTSDPVFDDTLKTALNISLRQSPFLSVLSESEVS